MKLKRVQKWIFKFMVFWQRQFNYLLNEWYRRQIESNKLITWAQAYKPPLHSIVFRIKSVKLNLTKRPSVTWAFRPHCHPLRPLSNSPSSQEHPLGGPTVPSGQTQVHPYLASPGSSLVTFKAQCRRKHPPGSLCWCTPSPKCVCSPYSSLSAQIQLQDSL